MYTAQELVERIKEQARIQDELIKDILAACDLNVNSLSQMTDKKGLSSFSLAKIADYLNCSTDYLLGRTAAPKTAAPSLTEKEQQLLAAYKAHPELQPSIDKLLDIEDEEIYRVAHSKSNHPGEIRKLTKEEKERFDKADPVTSDNEDL